MSNTGFYMNMCCIFLCHLNIHFCMFTFRLIIFIWPKMFYRNLSCIVNLNLYMFLCVIYKSVLNFRKYTFRNITLSTVVPPFIKSHPPKIRELGLWCDIINTTFNNISIISWRSILLMGETGENHWPNASHWQTLSHNVA